MSHLPEATTDRGPLSRRGFLERTAALAAAGLSLSDWQEPVWAEPSQPSKPVRLGFSLYGMRQLPVAKAIALCARIGYDAVELVANKDWPCDPARLTQRHRRDIRNALADAGLTAAGVMENLPVVVDDRRHRENLDRLKAAFELAHDVAPQAPPAVETVLGGRPAQWNQIKTEMVRRLADWADTCEKAHGVVALKPHVGGALHTPDDARWLMRQVDHPNVRLAYDYSHFVLRHFPLKESLEAMLPWTVFIHVKDAAGDAQRVRFLLPGEGDIDYVAYFRLLKQSPYRGPIVVEVSGQIHGKADYDPAKAATSSYAPLAEAMTQAGLPRPSGR